MLFVFVDRVRLDRDIVEIDCVETANILTENLIHILLKCRGGVAETLRHNNLFEHSEECFEGYFIDIVFFY